VNVAANSASLAFSPVDREQRGAERDVYKLNLYVQIQLVRTPT